MGGRGKERGGEETSSFNWKTTSGFDLEREILRGEANLLSSPDSPSIT